MQQIIQNVLDAADNLPGPNSGAETALNYLRTVLSPAIEDLRLLKKKLPSDKEFKMVKEVLEDVIDIADTRQEMTEAFSKLTGLDVIYKEGKYLKTLRLFVEKLDEILIKEEILGLTDAKSSKT